MNYRILILSIVIAGLLLIIAMLVWQGDRQLSRILVEIEKSEQTIIPEPISEPKSPAPEIHPHREAIVSLEKRAGMPLLRVARLITRDESVRTQPYLDSAGKVTIGVGRSLSTNGISVSELHAIVPEIDYRHLLGATAVRNGRVYIGSLSAATVIFKKPLTQHDIELLLTDDLKNVQKEALGVFGAQWNQISEARREVIVDTLFNLGLPHFKQFKKFITAVKNSDWNKAAADLLLSDAARKNVLRYHRNALVMKTGNRNYFDMLEAP